VNRSRQISILALTLAIVGPPAIAGIMAVWRDELNTATVAVVLTATVVGVSALGRRSAAIVAAATATLAFNFFHTQPYYSFAIHQTDELVTAAVLLAVGLLAAGIQTRSNRRQEEVVEATGEISRIGAVTDLVASGRSTDEIIELVALELRDLLGLRHCHYEQTPSDAESARIERTGEVSYGALVWRADLQGFPGHSVEIPVYAQGRWGGRFVGVPSPGRPISYEQRIVAVALADQLGAALAINLIV